MKKVAPPPKKRKGKPFSGAGHSLSSTPVVKKNSRSKKKQIPVADRREEMLAAAEKRFKTNELSLKSATPVQNRVVVNKHEITNWTPKDMN